MQVVKVDLVFVLEAGQDTDRGCRGEEALDRIAGHVAIGIEGPEGLVPVVEDVVDAGERLEAAPARREAAIEREEERARRFRGAGARL
jgi:hypothetical protein